MGCSEKIVYRAKGEVVFYWMMPLYLKPSKNVLPKGSPQNLRMKKRGYRNDVEIQFEILRNDLRSDKKEKRLAAVETIRRTISSPLHSHSLFKKIFV